MDGLTAGITISKPSKASSPSRRGVIRIAQMRIHPAKNGFIAEHFKTEAHSSSKGVRPPTALMPERHVFNSVGALADHVSKIFKPPTSKGEKF